MATAELGINIVARNQARSVLKGIQGDLRGMKSTLGEIAKFTAGNLIAGGITAGMSAITNGVKSGVGAFAAMSNEAAEFNAQISSIGAVAGASGAQIAELKQLALDLGVNPNLKVSAVEAAQAIEMLARNGLKVPEIMGGAAEATVLLANATGADFATAADIGTDAMALFGIEANNMIAAVDGITSVTTNSKFSINDYRLALAQGGGVAATVGVEFDDFNTSIAAIAPLFASGSDAGTSFKTFLQRLVPSTNPARDAMAELGLITADGANAFFDASGNMKDMAEITGILNRATKDLSEEQKIHYLSTIFGTDAMRAAAGIARLTTEEYQQLQETMSQTSAIDGAATRMDNLAGDMEIFRSVVESLRIQIGDEFQPALRAVFQSGTTLLSDFAPTIVATASSMATALEGTINRVMNIKQQFDFLASGGNVLGGILAGLGTATGAEVTVPIGAKVVSVDWGNLKLSFDNATKDFSITIADYVTGTFNLKDYTTTLAIGDLFTGTLNLKDRIASVSIGDFFAGAQIGTGGKITLTFNETEFSFDLSAIKDTIIAQLALVRSGLTVEALKLKFSGVVTTVSDSIKAIPEQVTAQINESISALKEIKISFDLSSIKNAIVVQFSLLKLGLLIAASQIDFQGVASSVSNSIKAIPAQVVTAVSETASSIDFAPVAAIITSSIGKIPALVTEQIGDLSGVLAMVTNVETIINSVLGENGIATKGVNFLTGIIDDFSASLATTDLTVVSGTVSSVTGDILSLTSAFADFQVETIKSATSSLSGFVTSVVELSTSLVESLNADEIGGILAGFATGFVGKFTAAIESVDAVQMAEAAGALLSSLSSALRNAFSTENTTEIGEAAGGLVRALLEQISSVFSSESLAQDLGSATGDLAVGILSSISGALGGIGDALEGSGGLIGLSEAAVSFTSNFLGGVAASLSKADYTQVAEAIRGGIQNAFDAASAVVGVDEEANRERLLRAQQNLATANQAITAVEESSASAADNAFAALRAEADRNTAETSAMGAVLVDVVSGAFRDIGTLFTNPGELFMPASAKGQALDEETIGPAKQAVTSFTQSVLDAQSRMGQAMPIEEPTSLITLTQSVASAESSVSSFAQTVATAQSQMGQLTQGPQTAEEAGFIREGLVQAQKGIEEFNVATGQQAGFVESFGQSTTTAIDSIQQVQDPAIAVSTSLTTAGQNITSIGQALLSVIGPMGLVAQAIIQVAQEVQSTISALRGVASAAMATAAAIRNSAPPSGGGGTGGGTGGPTLNNAIGTRNWRGGYTWVGETGPEMVALPRGSRIFSNSESMQLAGGGGVNVTVNVANVSSDIDIDAMAYRVAEAIRRRR